MNRPSALEQVDAAIFSGDILFDEAARNEIKEYAERWLRAINEHEDNMNTTIICSACNGSGEGRGDGAVCGMCGGTGSKRVAD